MRALLAMPRIIADQPWRGAGRSCVRLVSSTQNCDWLSLFARPLTAQPHDARRLRGVTMPRQDSLRVSRNPRAHVVPVRHLLKGVTGAE